MLTYEQALAFARGAHAGQVDKAGQPYIDHCIRVAEAMDTEGARVVAILHDVVEDTTVTLDDLYTAGMGCRHLAAIDAMTRGESEGYADYLKRLRCSELARFIKRADIADNLNEERLALLDTATAKRLRKKYRKALEMLGEE